MADLIKILIVEDSEEDQELYLRALRKGFDAPFQSFVAEEGATALELVQQQAPNVIILDYQLPDLDGLEVIRALQQAMPEEAVPPILMMTGQGCEQIAVEAMKLGISDYLVKGGITPRQLNQSIRSALKQAKLQKILAASEQRFRTSVETMLDCFGTYACVRNDAGDIIGFRTEYINAAAAQRANVHLHEDGKDFQVFEPPAWTEELFQEYCELIETGVPLCKEVLIYQKDGAEIDRAYDLRASKLDDGFVAIWREITGKKRAELERLELLRKEKEARAEAEAANQAKDEFVAMVSHDLRTPLNSILGWTQMLRRRSTSPETMERAVGVIERSAAHQLELINDLLDLSRVLSGTLELNCQPLDAIELCNMALATAYPTIEAKALHLTYQVDGRPWPVQDSNDLLDCFSQEKILFLGDSNRLAQVLGNLLSNAVKFTPSGGHITLALSALDGTLQLSVEDSGKGIAPELLPYVFERFHQGNHAEKSQGLGLGLAIARHIVDLHGGKIWADSAGLGKGTKMSVSLPLSSSLVA